MKQEPDTPNTEACLYLAFRSPDDTTPVEQLVPGHFVAGSVFVLLEPDSEEGRQGARKPGFPQRRIMPLGDRQGYWRMTVSDPGDARFLPFAGIRHIALHRSGPLGKYRQLVASFAKEAERLFAEHVRNAATVAALGRRWLGNLFRNVAHLASSGPAQKFPKASREKAVLLGAGPSLTMFLDDLASNGQATETRATAATVGEQQSPYLLAVDTCLPVLQEHNVMPDGIVAVEAQHWNLLDFLPLQGEFCQKFEGDLFVDLFGLPGALRLFPSARITPFVSRAAWPSFIDALEATNSVPLVPALGNVSATGLYILQLVGYRDIDCYGVDLGLSDPQQLLRGGHHHLWALGNNERTSPTAANTEAESLSPPLYSTPAWRAELERFYELMQAMPGKVLLKSLRGRLLVEADPLRVHPALPELHQQSSFSSPTTNAGVLREFLAEMLDRLRNCLTAPQGDRALDTFLVNEGEIFLAGSKAAALRELEAELRRTFKLD